MNQDNLARANKQVGVLIGLRGLTFERYVDLIDIGFGSGGLQHTLRLFGYFRIRDDEAILVANSEIRSPSSIALSRPTFSYSTFIWDSPGENCFDEWVSLNSSLLESLEVIDTQVNSIGDLSVFLSHDIIIEVFIDSVVEECWRVYKTEGDSPHFIMDGNGSGFILE